MILSYGRTDGRTDLSSTAGDISLLCQESSRKYFVLNGATLGTESSLSIWDCFFNRLMKMMLGMLIQWKKTSLEFASKWRRSWQRKLMQC